MDDTFSHFFAPVCRCVEAKTAESGGLRDGEECEKENVEALKTLLYITPHVNVRLPTCESVFSVFFSTITKLYTNLRLPV
uniref:Uncharacterized protein n=1 Tax=Hyaloperonospora arabidopsidis (strain Emoy2) TaxID=559515 RepID=M4BUJ0_HYAAE